MQLLRDNLTLWTSDLQDGKPLSGSEAFPRDADLSLTSAPQAEAATKEDDAPAPIGEEAA